MRLSKRLQAVVSLVPPGSRTADVGTDHAYVPITLVENGTAPKAYAMDVRDGPLARAAEHVREAGLADRIEVRKSDGLDALLPGEADCVVIIGLGGPLMTEILERGKETAQTVSAFVLSPQSDITRVRIYLREHGYRIEREIFLKDEEKYYTVMRAVHGVTPPGRDIDDLFGKSLLDAGDETLAECLRRQREILLSVLAGLAGNESDEAKKRSDELKKALAQADEGLSLLAQSAGRKS